MVYFGIVALLWASLLAAPATVAAQDTVVVNKVDTVYVVKDGGAPSLADFVEAERDTRGHMLTVIEILVGFVAVAAAFAAIFGYQARREARAEIESIRKRTDEVDTQCEKARQLLKKIEEHEETAGSIVENTRKRIEKSESKVEQEAQEKGVKATDIEERLKLITDEDAEADVKHYEEIRDQLVRKIPTDIHKAMARNYLSLKSYGKAEEELSICLGVNPRDGEANFLMGFAKVSQEKYRDSLEYWEKSVAAVHRNAVAYYNWGRTLQAIYEEEKNVIYLHEAIKKYEQAVVADPSYADAYYNWGTTLYALYEVEKNVRYLHEAVNKCKQAAAAEPSHAATYYFNWGNGLVHLYKSEHDIKYLHEAVKRYEQAIEVDPTLAAAFYYLASAYSLMRKKDEMLTSLKKAISLDRARVEKARQDADFEAFRDDPNFIRVLASPPEPGASGPPSA